ncbi:MAG: type II toxin-antitoxin system Phd/YefM family antitoxin [Planctomycetes bacterium]|nr:type II toxin-antitoxin system Phd/YefM family antitoxin [Planctomycetota bacterium]
MILKQDIRPITYLKSNAAGVLDYINDTHRSIVITQNGEAKGVLLDPETYDKTQQAFALLKIVSQSEKEIKSGLGTTQKAVFKNLQKKLNAKT